MLSTSDYRHLARASLKRSIELQEAGEDHSLVYAALELRMALEALTYERAQAFKGEFPPSEYTTWQPKKVMAVLLEIDGNADKDSSLFIGEEEEYGNGSSKRDCPKFCVTDHELPTERASMLGGTFHADTQRDLGRAAQGLQVS